ncbi:elongation factor G [Paenibacillus solani]|uniref:Tetracycline resistance protein n=1 Tax=Paenibacillus solani TaxID=1705565 RepID=A0A0M1P3H3_9BACL|nr:TetM/TetW/TetO/TetS family tetracycline resistance ribosomal protection protein [Paenibacillus solani]KOR89036.1 tetracycline resistance protein [Paenibacillus solani]
MKKILNIGVLAHVDAGKTTLTEQILFRSGIIEHAGSVDEGNTITDSLDIERRRGITVKSAAVSFMLDDMKINLIDTPGHADFISEVEHSLSVLDGVILVISAVEGVQAQTRVLMQTLKEHCIPTILFMNKIDRMGANYQNVYTMIRNLLDEHICEMSFVTEEGSATVRVDAADPDIDGWIETLSGANENLLHDYIQDIPITRERLLEELRSQTRQGKAYPLFAGSAAKGIGIEALLHALGEFFPANDTSELQHEPLSGLVFKVIKLPNGERNVYLRLFAGRIEARDEITVITQNGQTTMFKVKHLRALQQGKSMSVELIDAGDIAILITDELKVGDVIGTASDKMKLVHFQKPPIQVQVSAKNSAEDHQLHTALSNLTEEDPFLQYIRDTHTKEHIIHIFGIVQQEILLETIQHQYGIEAVFSAPQVICIEKPLHVGEAVEYMEECPFYATVGLRVEPGERGSGLLYRLEVELGSLPLSFQKAIKDTVMEVLQEGLHGWSVTDIVVTLTHTGYASPVSTAKDFRSLTPLVLMAALSQAGTEVYEPVNTIQFILPESSLSKVLSKLAVLEGTYQEPIFYNKAVHVHGTLPVRTTDLLKAEVHSLTSGKGMLSVKPGGYVKVHSNLPVNKRRLVNPLNRGEYMLYLNKIM